MAQVVGHFIPAPQRADMVYDEPRDILYITNGDHVIRYDVSASLYLAPIDLSAFSPQLVGIDLSPDGRWLLVCDQSESAGLPRLFAIDLTTGGVASQTFPRDPHIRQEAGTFAVAFGNDGAGLLTSRFNGSGWVPLRRYVPGSGEFGVLDTVRQDTMVSANADGSIIAFAETNSTGGEWGRYRVADGDIVHREWGNGTGTFNYEVGVNRNATQYAIVTGVPTFVYNGSYQQIATIRTPGGPGPCGVSYDPGRDLIYFAWDDTRYVRTYDTNSLTQVREYDFGHTFQGPEYYYGFVDGRVRISRGGGLLAATVGGGVRYIRLGPGVWAYDMTDFDEEDRSAAITFGATSEEPGSIGYTIVTPPSHGRVFAIIPPSVYSYHPDQDYFGPDSFTYQASIGGMVSNIARVDLFLASVNDAPTFTKGPNLTVNEDCGPQAFPNWATGMSAGPANESNQTLHFNVPSTSSLLSTQVAVSPEGTLTFTPAADANGVLGTRIRLADDGGTANGGLDESEEQNSQITIRSVNDAPSFTPGADVTVDEDCGAQSTKWWATNIKRGPANESWQTIHFEVSTANPELFAVAPSVGTTYGTLAFTPAANAYGAATVTMQLIDNGGTANGGVDRSPERTFTITVRPVDDAPALANGTAPAMGRDDRGLTFQVTYTDPDGDPPSPGVRLHLLRAGVEVAGSPFAMTGAATTGYEDGVVFSCARTLLWGDYSHYFEASDGHSPATGDPTVEAPGPEVISGPLMAGPAVSPPSGDADTLFDYSVTYSSADGKPANYVTLQVRAYYSATLTWSTYSFRRNSVTSGCAVVWNLQPGTRYPTATEFEYRFTAQKGSAPATWTTYTTWTPGPVISSGPAAPTLTNGTAPAIGREGRRFTFGVTYTDPDGDPPRPGVKLHLLRAGAEVTGSPFGMTGAATTGYETGVVFSCSRTLPWGDYSHYFEASDGRSPATGDATSEAAGPEVISEPLLADPAVSPTSGDAGTRFEYSVTYSSADGKPANYVTLQVRAYYPSTLAWSTYSFKRSSVASGSAAAWSLQLGTRYPTATEFQYRFTAQKGSAPGLWTTYTTWTPGPVVATGIAAARLSSLAVTAAPAGGAEIVFSLSSPADVTARLLNLAGRPVRTLPARACAAGLNTLLWDGQSDLGLRAPSGTYLMEITARTDSGTQDRRLAPLRVSR